MELKKSFLTKEDVVDDLVKKLYREQNRMTKIIIKNNNGVINFETSDNPISILIALEVVKATVIKKYHVPIEVSLLIEKIYSKE